MLQSIYISGNGNVELRNGSLNYKIRTNLRENPLPSSSNRVCLIEIGKDMDYFNINNVISKQNLEANLKSKINRTDLRYIINFAIEESVVNKRLIAFIKEILNIPDSHLLIVTNNMDYISESNYVWYNSNEWVMANVGDSTFTAFIKELRTYDLGTIKKKFLFLNNHFSKIRFDILKLIYKNNKQKEGNISFNIIDFNQPHDGIISEEEFLKECEEYGIEYPSYYDTLPGLSQIGEEEVNRNKILGINHIGTVNLNYRIYFDAFFEIITETTHLLKLNGTYTSEKVHKPIKCGLPFVYYGKASVKEMFEKNGLTFNSPIYFFGEGDDFLNHLEFLLEQDIEWYNKIQKKYLDEYINNLMRYNSLQVKNSELITNFIFR